MTIGFEPLFNQVLAYTVYHSQRTHHTDTKTISGRLYHFNITIAGTLTAIPLEMLSAAEQLVVKLPLVILSTPIKYTLGPISATARALKLNNFSRKLDDTAAKLPGAQAIYLTAIKIVAFSLGAASTTTIGLLISTQTNHTIHDKLGITIPNYQPQRTIHELEKENTLLKQFDGIDALKQSAKTEKKSLLKQIAQKDENYDRLLDEKFQLEKEKNAEIAKLRKELQQLRSAPQTEELPHLPASPNDPSEKIQRLQHKIAELKQELEQSKQIAVEKENEFNTLAKKAAWIPDLQGKILSLQGELETLKGKQSAVLQENGSAVRQLKIEKDRETGQLNAKITKLENRLSKTKSNLASTQILKELTEGQNKQLQTSLHERGPVESPLAPSNRK